MSPATIAIIVAEATPQIPKDGTAEEQIKAAMRAACNHWMELDENEQIRGALAAVFPFLSEEDQQRVRSEMEVHKALSAAASGVPVDMGRMLEHAGELKGFGLSKLWAEAKAEGRTP